MQVIYNFLTSFYCAIFNLEKMKNMRGFCALEVVNWENDNEKMIFDCVMFNKFKSAIFLSTLHFLYRAT